MADQNKLTSDEIDKYLDEIDDEKEANTSPKNDDFFVHQVIRHDDNPWMPNRGVMNDWMASLISRATQKKEDAAIAQKLSVDLKLGKETGLLSDLHFRNMHPIIASFADAVIGNPIMRRLINGMVDENKSAHPDSPVKKPVHLFYILNEVLTRPPTYNDDQNKIVSIPLATAFGDFAATDSGKELFNRPDITKIFGQYLKHYKDFLDSEKSKDTLYNPETGWMTQAGAMEMMQMEDYIVPKGGFKSWNEYFSRAVKPSARPIVQPENDLIVTCPIDGVIYNIEHDVKRFSTFWIKRQPYSLQALLNNDETYVKKFEGGTVWQAFLDPFNYHRWHTPVAGKVVDVVQVGGLNPSSKDDLLCSQGLYYSILKWPGFGDFKDWTGSLPYMAMVNRRAIVYIESETVGLVAVIPIGMLEVSSVTVTVKKGKKVKKGDEFGMFQYGGSTFAMVFQKDRIRNFNPLPPKHIRLSQLPIVMGQKIAIAKKK